MAIIELGLRAKINKIIEEDLVVVFKVLQFINAGGRRFGSGLNSFKIVNVYATYIMLIML